MKKLIINVSGFVFIVTEQCLERYPNTLLGNYDRRMSYYNKKEGQFFFDRHRLAFEGVLMFYQSYGRVMCPPNVPEEVFQSELRFFEIECVYLDQMEEAKRFVVATNPNPKDLRELSLKKRIWEIMHNPASSFGAQILSSFSMCVTVVSIGLSCYTQEPGEMKIQADTFPIETACFIWFTLEFLLRLFTCPEKIKLLKSWIDITDLATLLIFYFSLALTSTQASSTSVLRIFRLANAFRVFRLTRFSNGLRLLIYTIYTSRTDLQLLSSFMAFFILISGSLVYFADISDPESDFNQDGIFSGFWFSLISCTTVGYGDITPITGLGKFMAALTITFGAMFILLPVLKLVSAFSDALQATRSLLEKREEEEAKENQ
ncbi:potassium voltage-gated channel subfamily A member 10-like [Clytia hemisphaerica]|uniref:potassium voltage-gated channel subfamily A member 10-like n=1 Tax=Clytia hemisphaerica TaxID=252671 RepID=UPI0034D5C15A